MVTRQFIYLRLVGNFKLLFDNYQITMKNLFILKLHSRHIINGIS